MGSAVISFRLSESVFDVSTLFHNSSVDCPLMSLRKYSTRHIPLCCCYGVHAALMKSTHLSVGYAS